VRTTARRRAYARRTRTTLPGLALLAVLALLGCGAAGSVPDASQPPSSAPTSSSTPTVSVPADGVSLSALGFENGPVDRVFVPVGAQMSSRVDQPNNVTVVMTYPRAAELQAFYRRTSVANGFTVTADDAAARTLTFAGFGWTGTFTGDSQASALLLRPAP
jgi:hypothetical protein